MVATIKDVKGAFISCCAKINGMPIGRTNFQDFEIAYLINVAYEKCVKNRVDALYQSFATHGNTANHPRRDHPMGNILAELGNLYAPTVIDDELASLGSVDIDRYKLWGANSRLFEVPKVNGYFPYVIGVDLHEVNPKAEDMYRRSNRMAEWDLIKKDGGQRAMEIAESNLQSWNRTFPVRLINASEQLEYSLLMQQGGNMIDKLPYRIGRIRTFSYLSLGLLIDSVTDKVMEALEAVMGGSNPESERMADMRGLWGWESVYGIELLHPKTEPGTELYISIERVMHPEPITEEDIKTESLDFIDVAFGYEIAYSAAQIGMEALASGTKIPQNPPNTSSAPA